MGFGMLQLTTRGPVLLKLCAIFGFFNLHLVARNNEISLQNSRRLYLCFSKTAEGVYFALKVKTQIHWWKKGLSQSVVRD